MRKAIFTNAIAICALVLAAASCEKAGGSTEVYGLSEIRIRPVIGNPTKLDTPDADGSDARSEFISGDRFMLTKICRTLYPIEGFTYYSKEFRCNDNGGWLRSNNVNEKIYWTDAKDHTFIGYSLPQMEQNGEETRYFKFNKAEGGDIYTGELETDQTTVAKLKETDLLLTYATDVKANITQDDVAADLHLYHALAKVKIALNINGFAADSDASHDISTEVDAISLTDQPVEYTWDQTSVAVTAAESDPCESEVSAWLKPESLGTENEKHFLAYALIVPGTRDFKVKLTISYDDAANNYTKKTEHYEAVFKNVVFTAGKRTTLNITLSHVNEGILVDAVYSDWREVNLNNESELMQKSIFLQTTDMTGAGSPQLGTEAIDAEKADWLYTDEDTEKVLDIYGNDGSEDAPYLIKNAFEFLAFAKEVNSGRSFEGQHVKLFTDIYLQPGNKKENLIWPGIGNGTSIFSGAFDGNGATILSLVGNPVFNALDTKAVVKNLAVQTYDARKTSTEGIAKSSKAAIICTSNNGCIYGCSTWGTVRGTELAGGIAAINNGTIAGCFHQGEVTADTAAGGIVGTNNGAVRACYQAAGTVRATTAGGVCSSMGESGSARWCYYEIDFAPGITAVNGQTDSEDYSGYRGCSSSSMMITSFKDKLNEGLDGFEGCESVIYIQNAGEYPVLER